MRLEGLTKSFMSEAEFLEIVFAANSSQLQQCHGAVTTHSGDAL
jgi:hypothetical protein